MFFYNKKWTQLILFIIGLSITFSLSAQELFKRKIYPNIDLYNLTSLNSNILERDNGNFIMNVGDPTSTIIIEINNVGETIWAKRIYQPGNENIFTSGFIATPDGGFLLTAVDGLSYTSPNNKLIKLNALGEIEWAKSLGIDFQGPAWTINTSDGGFAMTGSSENINFGLSDVSFTKLNEDGIILWSKIYGAEEYERGYVPHELPNGDFLILCSKGNPIDLMVIRLDADGNLIFAKKFENIGGANADQSLMVALADGNFVIRGLKNNSIMAILIKINEQGEILWAKEHQNILRMDTLADGGLITLGFTFNSSSPVMDTELLISKIDVGGNLLWSKTVDIADIEPRFIKELSDGSILALCENAGYDYFSLLTLDTVGATCLNTSYNYPQNFPDVEVETTEIDLFMMDAVFEDTLIVMMEVIMVQDNLDCFLTEIEERESNRPTIAIHPNPTNGFVNLDFSNIATDIEIVIYDANGRAIRRFNANNQETMQIDVSDLSKGVYFIEGRQSTVISIQKLIKI